MNNKQIREKSIVALQTHLEVLRAELFGLRFQSATGQLEKPHKINELKKEVARILTNLQERKIAGADIKPLNMQKLPDKFLDSKQDKAKAKKAKSAIEVKAVKTKEKTKEVKEVKEVSSKIEEKTEKTEKTSLKKVAKAKVSDTNKTVKEPKTTKASKTVKEPKTIKESKTTKKTTKKGEEK